MYSAQTFTGRTLVIHNTPVTAAIFNDLKQIRAGDGIHLSDSPIVENKKVVFAQFPEFPHIILLELSSGVEFLEE